MNPYYHIDTEKSLLCTYSSSVFLELTGFILMQNINTVFIMYYVFMYILLCINICHRNVRSYLNYILSKEGAEYCILTYMLHEIKYCTEKQFSE